MSRSKHPNEHIKLCLLEPDGLFHNQGATRNCLEKRRHLCCFFFSFRRKHSPFLIKDGSSISANLLESSHCCFGTHTHFSHWSSHVNPASSSKDESGSLPVCSAWSLARWIYKITWTRYLSNLAASQEVFTGVWACYCTCEHNSILHCGYCRRHVLKR